MNIFIYCLENNIINENGEIKTDDITRNVWVVDVKHNKETKPKDAEIETVKKLYNKKYYIDATTGEIIGGEQLELPESMKIKNRRIDPAFMDWKNTF